MMLVALGLTNESTTHRWLVEASPPLDIEFFKAQCKLEQGAIR